LEKAVTEPPNPLIAEQDNGVAYMAVGYIETEQGLGWFDQALLYCPFCGTKLLDAEEIKHKVSN
jgi:hypothetical protein